MRCLPKQEVDPIFLRSLGNIFLGGDGGGREEQYIKGGKKKEYRLDLCLSFPELL